MRSYDLYMWLALQPPLAPIQNVAAVRGVGSDHSEPDLGTTEQVEVAGFRRCHGELAPQVRYQWANH